MDQKDDQLEWEDNHEKDEQLEENNHNDLLEQSTTQAEMDWNSPVSSSERNDHPEVEESPADDAALARKMAEEEKSSQLMKYEQVRKDEEIVRAMFPHCQLKEQKYCPPSSK